MNLQNLQRDQSHTTSKNLGIASFSSSTTIASNTFNINAPVTVFSDVAAAQSLGLSPGFTAGNWGSFGVFLQPPATDDTPYRVKGHVRGAQAYVVVGIGPASPSGTDDNCSLIAAFPVSGEFDEMINVINLPESDPDFGKSIAFGIASGDANLTEGFISVQRLAAAPPQYASSVS